MAALRSISGARRRASTRNLLAAVSVAAMGATTLVAPAPAAQVATDAGAAPTIREVALSGVDAKVLAASPKSGKGTVASSRVKLRPAIAASIRVTKPAELVAVSADAQFADGSSVSVRVREHGKWGVWTALELDRDHGPDPDSAEALGARIGSDPLLTDNATDVEVRIDTPSGKTPVGTDLTLVDVPPRPADSKLGQGRMSTLGVTGMPSILTRAQWGANESWRNRAPVYTDNIQIGFVHHTASTSAYSPDQAAAQVRAIYAYHTRSLKHSDIDYNFLVDRFGRLYEGRFGGMDQAVQGGHTAGFNDHSFAIVALGNFETFAAPPSEMVAIKESIARLFAWKLGLSGVNPGATVSVVSAGYYKKTRYPKGTVAKLPAMSSHQMVNFTSCPGKYLQAELASIRDLAASYSNAVISVPNPEIQQFVSGSRPALAINSNTTAAANWQLDIMSPCSDTPVRTLSGSAGGPGPISISWDLLDSAGAPVLPATYTLRLNGTPVGGAPIVELTSHVTISPAPGGAWGPCANVSRIVGANVAATSVLYGQQAAPGAKTVVLVGEATSSPAAFSAGVVAAPLARKLGAPLLISPPAALAAEVRADIAARGATEVVVVGDATVISDAAAAEIAAMGVTVTRLAGADDAGTAAAVAARFGTSASVVLASTTSAAGHALAAAGLAGAAGVPVLLTNVDGVPAATQAALAALGTTTITAAVPVGIPDAVLAGGLGGRAWTRVSGNDNPEGSVAIANAFPAQSQSAVLLGDSPATWGAAPAVAAMGQPVLITSQAAMAPSVMAYYTGRPGLTFTSIPVDFSVLDDALAGTASRLMLGLPLTGPTAVTVAAPAPPAVTPPPPPAVAAATTARKIYSAKAAPKTVKRGKTITITARVTAKYSDKKWRAAPAGIPFKLYFKASGKHKYKKFSTGVSADGSVSASVAPKSSGKWKFRLGGKYSGATFVRVKK